MIEPGSSAASRRRQAASTLRPTVGRPEYRERELSQAVFRHGRRDRGAAAVEFALVVPVLLVLVMGIIDLRPVLQRPPRGQAGHPGGRPRGGRSTDCAAGDCAGLLRRRSSHEARLPGGRPRPAHRRTPMRKCVETASRTAGGRGTSCGSASSSARTASRASRRCRTRSSARSECASSTTYSPAATGTARAATRADRVGAGADECDSDERRGAIAILVAVFALVMFGFAAIVVDLGMVRVTKADSRSRCGRCGTRRCGGALPRTETRRRSRQAAVEAREGLRRTERNGSRRLGRAARRDHAWPVWVKWPTGGTTASCSTRRPAPRRVFVADPSVSTLPSVASSGTRGSDVSRDQPRRRPGTQPLPGLRALRSRPARRDGG